MGNCGCPGMGLTRPGGKSVPNIGTPQYIRQTLIDIKGDIDSNIKIVGDFNTPVIPMES